MCPKLWLNIHLYNKAKLYTYQKLSMLSKLNLEHKFLSNVKITMKNKMFMVWNNAAIIYSSNNTDIASGL